MYSGVPQAVLQMDPATSSLEYPKSQILTTGRSPRPCSSTLSSCRYTDVCNQVALMLRQMHMLSST